MDRTLLRQTVNLDTNMMHLYIGFRYTSSARALPFQTVRVEPHSAPWGLQDAFNRYRLNATVAIGFGRYLGRGVEPELKIFGTSGNNPDPAQWHLEAVFWQADSEEQDPHIMATGVSDAFADHGTALQRFFNLNDAIIANRGFILSAVIVPPIGSREMSEPQVLIRRT